MIHSPRIKVLPKQVTVSSVLHPAAAPSHPSGAEPFPIPNH